jgi:hypothetical protein
VGGGDFEVNGMYNKVYQYEIAVLKIIDHLSVVASFILKGRTALTPWCRFLATPLAYLSCP